MVMHSGTPKVNIKDVKMVTNTWRRGGGVGGNEACLMILPDPKNCQISCTLLTFIPHELRFYL